MSKILFLCVVLIGCMVCAATSDLSFENEGRFIGSTHLTMADLEAKLKASALFRNFELRNQIRAMWSQEEPEKPKIPALCIICKVLTGIEMILQAILGPGLVHGDLIEDVVVFFCETLEIAPRKDNCAKMIGQYKEPIIHIITQTNMGHDDICGIISKNCASDAIDGWNVTISGDKPDTPNRTPIPATTESLTKIIQFTDVHVDLKYTQGANTNCGKEMPTCCRPPEFDEKGNDIENPYNFTIPAGKWGDFHCGLPIHTLEKMYEHARDTHKDARYVFLTGDYTHSRVWEYSREENKAHIIEVTTRLTNVFKDSPAIIYPLVGNHEPHVVNMYPPRDQWSNPNFSIEWLYRAVMAPFQERNESFLLPEEFERFYAFGYYSARPEPKLRLIVLNTNICSPENFWLGYLTSPEQEAFTQLKWFAGELQAAEDAQENVLIVGHIEPGSCFAHWSEQYNLIVDRYEAIIRGSFFGHSHKPHYRVATAKGTMKPIVSSFIAGSGVPDSMNPSYSVFLVDGERGEESYWDVLRQELYIVDLLQSNDGDRDSPVIEKLIDSYKDFGLPNLAPASIFEFADKMICDQDMIDRYATFRMKGKTSPAYKSCPTYGKTCRYDLLCSIFDSNAADDTGCTTFKTKINTTDCSTKGNSDSDSGSAQTNKSTTYFFVMMTITMIVKIMA